MTHRIVLKDAYKGYTLDLDKFIPPQETVRRFKDKLKGIRLDILEDTVRIDNGRLDIPVFFSLCGRDAEAVIGAKKQMGKGGTPAQAEASAIMELAERFSLFSFQQNPRNFLVEKYAQVKDRALSLDMISRSVHDRSEDLQEACEVFSEIPLHWTPAYNLTRRQELLVPFDWFFAINEFNGSSAGNCLEEAALQGLCEVVERHVSSIISQNRLKTPAINLISATDPLALELIRKYKRAGIRLYVTDFSMDTGIPTVGVLAYDPTTFPEKSEIVWTAGTTPHPQKSLIRALTEVAQLAGDFNTNSDYVASGLPKLKDLKEAHFVTHPDGEVNLGDLPDLSHGNIRVEVENAIDALSRIGMEVIVVDVTHPVLGIPAVYVLIPGAHFRERAANTSMAMFSAKLISQSKDPIRAVGALNRMDDRLPGRYFIKFFLGQVYLSLQEPSQALGYLETALDLDPHPQDIPSIYSYMGLCLKELERYDEAIYKLKQAEEFDRERTDIYNLMGFCFFKLREHEKAISCFQRVLELNPGSAIDYANIASNYRDMGDKEKAIEYYRFALEMDPGIDFARENLHKLQ